MYRSVASIVAGYFIMAIGGATMMLLVAVGLGPAFVYAPGSRAPSPAYLAVVTAVVLISAVVGGVVAALIAPRANGRGPVLVLAVVVLLLGAGMTLASTRTGDVEPELTSIPNPRLPGWIRLVLPPLAAGGITLGGLAVVGRRDRPTGRRVSRSP